MNKNEVDYLHYLIFFPSEIPLNAKMEVITQCPVKLKITQKDRRQNWRFLFESQRISGHLRKL